ncbi:hypothetical protein [Marinimicrobium sp. ABcell2]|uniref:hypothetical protein n=1 Tax=Marinimicrobium sp. ABcell2 TaxID=3069751 RepID=UPI0027B0610A|nr:hypothetical protein [Marinimicrobium sp. ABcell2]MDQ2075065.1 hypothetical protein [Marinimicrobium sp. ABcell2]
MTSPRHLSAALALSLAAASNAQTVDLDQLWLPQSYLRHLPRLYDAAQLVDASSRCVEFITGTVAVDRSSLEHPVFTFTCRNRERQTYSLLVDGLTLKKVDSTRPEGFISFEELEKEYQRERELALERERQREELEALRAQRQQEREEQQRREAWQKEEQARAELLWETCQAQLQDRVGNMSQLVWLTDTMPEPSYETEPEVGEQPPFVFVIDFNARDIVGQALRYRARCIVASTVEHRLEIGARREADEEPLK